jgi:hypothetical protein
VQKVCIKQDDLERFVTICESRRRLEISFALPVLSSRALFPEPGEPFRYSMGMDLSWLGNLTKPFSSLLKPPAERIGKWLGRRKPRLFIHPNLGQSLWCITGQAGTNDPTTELMQIVFWAEITHDDDKQTLVIMDAYPDGTHSQLNSMTQFRIPPSTLVHEQISAFVLPIKGERGRPYKSRFVLIDQFHRKYKTQELVFRWVGAPPPATTSSGGDLPTG